MGMDIGSTHSRPQQWMKVRLFFIYKQMYDLHKLKSIDMTKKKKKVKQSHYRPEQAQRVPGGWGSQISRQSAHEGGRVVSPTHRPLFTPRKYSQYSFLLEADLTPGPQCGQKDLCQWKIPMTPSGIEPATFWLVVQCLNQLRHRGPHIDMSRVR